VIVHLSDLHLGKSAAVERAAWALREAIERAEHTVITGDVTHRGLRKELALFWAIFGDLLEAGRLTVVPGNHDRLGDDVADALMASPRVQLRTLKDLCLLRIDSTGDHNTSLMMPHGALCEFDLAAVEREVALIDRPCIALLHHHPVRLPEDSFGEWLGSKLRVTQARELVGGEALLDALMGKVQIVLFGHRHVPRHLRLARGRHTIDLFNAGSSTELRAFRMLEIVDGRLRAAPWQRLDDDDARAGEHELHDRRRHVVEETVRR
jgi:3',5'-cyclic AMP phosphodiesterase CpdA